MSKQMSVITDVCQYRYPFRQPNPAEEHNTFTHHLQMAILYTQMTSISCMLKQWSILFTMQQLP